MFHWRSTTDSRIILKSVQNKSLMQCQNHTELTLYFSKLHWEISQNRDMKHFFSNQILIASSNVIKTWRHGALHFHLCFVQVTIKEHFALHKIFVSRSPNVFFLIFVFISVRSTREELFELKQPVLTKKRRFTIFVRNANNTRC